MVTRSIFPWRSREDLPFTLWERTGLPGHRWPSSHPGLGLNSACLSTGLTTLCICVCAALRAVSPWWQHPKAQPGLWFQSYMRICHMDNPAVTCLVDYYRLKLKVHMEMFFCVCAHWFCQTSCFNYSSLLMNKWKGETSKVAKYPVLVTNTEGFFLMYNQKVGLRFTPLICSWLFFLHIKKREIPVSCN